MGEGERSLVSGGGMGMRGVSGGGGVGPDTVMIEFYLMQFFEHPRIRIREKSREGKGKEKTRHHLGLGR